MSLNSEKLSKSQLESLNNYRKEVEEYAALVNKKDINPRIINKEREDVLIASKEHLRVCFKKAHLNEFVSKELQARLIDSLATDDISLKALEEMHATVEEYIEETRAAIRDLELQKIDLQSQLNAKNKTPSSLQIQRKIEHIDRQIKHAQQSIDPLLASAPAMAGNTLQHKLLVQKTTILQRIAGAISLGLSIAFTFISNALRGLFSQNTMNSNIFTNILKFVPEPSAQIAAVVAPAILEGTHATLEKIPEFKIQHSLNERKISNTEYALHEKALAETFDYDEDLASKAPAAKNESTEDIHDVTYDKSRSLHWSRSKKVEPYIKGNLNDKHDELQVQQSSRSRGSFHRPSDPKPRFSH